MKLWIFHHYATLPNLNGHIRPYMFATYLASYGVSTVIFAASYQHFSDINLITNNARCSFESANKADFVFINTPSSAAGGAARIKNMLAFYKGLMNIYGKISDKPDIILASSPHPLAMLAGIKIAQKLNVPCICEVRDLWPEAIFYATNVKPNSILGRLLTTGEHWIYKHADSLVFTKEGDIDYLKEHNWLTSQGGDIDPHKCHYINNGVDLEEYHRQIKEYPYIDSDLESDTFKIVYAGTIRPINNIANLIETAKLLRDDSKVQILIFGDGSQRAELEQRVRQENITNVKFKGFVEKKYIPHILSKSSVNLLNYSSSRYNWSRGNSSNKLFEYMASGRPIIATMKTGYSIIDKYKCGIELNSDDPKLLASAILRVKDMPQAEYLEMCINAVCGARDFDYRALSDKLMLVINKALAKNKGTNPSND